VDDQGATAQPAMHAAPAAACKHLQACRRRGSWEQHHAGMHVVTAGMVGRLVGVCMQHVAGTAMACWLAACPPVYHRQAGAAGTAPC
jgi:hypothetical protein